MALFDIFKKSKKELEGKEKKEPKEVKMKKVKEAKEEPEAPKPPRRIEKKQFSEAWRFLDSTHVTEKSSKLSEQGIYVFKAKPAANKTEIKKAVQDLYGVAVERVNIVNIPRKARRLGRSQGYKSGYKKAMVKLAEGEKIEIMPR